MVQMCIVSGGNVLIQRVVNDLGTVALAANTAAGRIENIYGKTATLFCSRRKAMRRNALQRFAII